MGFLNFLSRSGPRSFSKIFKANRSFISVMLPQTRSFSTPPQNTEGIKFIRRFNSGTQLIPDDAKIERGGEDAFLITQDLVGVADGVGGWADVGVDPGLYSRALCEHIKNSHLKDNRSEGVPSIQKSLRLLIIEAAQNTVLLGSSTLVLALLDPSQNVLHTANFGDSGYMLLRKEGRAVKKLFRSQEMQKEFNHPYQIGYRRNGDDPSLSEVNKHEIKSGDLIILGTDGCFDNLFEEDILSIVEPIMLEQDKIEQPEIIAQAIARKAYDCSHISGRQSPFGKNSQGLYYGGKPDDITVVVAQIQVKEEEVKPDDL